MGESRSVIRQTQDTRCYVNIPTTQRSSTLPLHCAAPAPRMNHWATSGLACWKGLCRFGTPCVCGVCRFGPDDPRLRLLLSSPWLPTSQITAVAQCSLAVLTLAGPKKAPWIHRQTFCSTVERKKSYNHFWHRSDSRLPGV